MTSILKVDTIQDTAGNNIINESGDTITIGASGDTITIPSGATLSNLGTASGFYSNSDALTLFNATGSAPVYACRAWVNFNGTGTPAIREDGNVTSITDNGTGNYTINFTTDVPDANYVATAIGQQVSGVGNNGTVGIYPDAAVPTASALRILTGVGNATNDFTYVNVAIFR
jgi:hypothetical protein